MTATFWTGSSLSFTNGSKTVTVNTGPSLDSVKANSSLTAGNYNEPVEVKSVSGNTVTLYNNWPGSTGTTSATIKPSAAAAASAGVAAQQLINDIQSLVSSASATATANSFVKRDSNGRIKSASPSANDDVVTKGYFQSEAALSAAGILHNGNSSNPLEYGLGNRSFLTFNDWNAIPNEYRGFLRIQYNASNTPAGIDPQRVYHGVYVGSNFSPMIKIWGGDDNQTYLEYTVLVKYANNAWEGSPTFTLKAENYTTANANFNEFGGGAANDIAIKDGVVDSATTALFYAPLNSNSDPTSLTISPSALFKVSDKRTGASLGTTNNFGLISTSSRNVALLRAQGLTGLTVGTIVRLDISNAGSKINVNI